ncbi:YwdI family protein [Heyndrickxia vini]|uniref:YwdI family protein n=1 Tax=Heyndrickxia vini TaxID=1476025 RepID=A0ABX7E1X4_9BACI|nr:YwdI family protein [Heyndrickxia vini]QQZ09260.1 YwdI family protein [Heyndrickxia vini]
MSISINSLLNKIEQEVNYAKESERESVLKNHIYSVKTLCELILAEGQSISTSYAIPNKVQVEHSLPQDKPIMSVGKAEPLKTDDGSNGESIFDF